MGPRNDQKPKQLSNIFKQEFLERCLEWFEPSYYKTAGRHNESNEIFGQIPPYCNPLHLIDTRSWQKRCHSQQYEWISKTILLNVLLKRICYASPPVLFGSKWKHILQRIVTNFHGSTFLLQLLQDEDDFGDHDDKLYNHSSHWDDLTRVS